MVERFGGTVCLVIASVCVHWYTSMSGVCMAVYRIREVTDGLMYNLANISKQVQQATSRSYDSSSEFNNLKCIPASYY